MAHQSWHWKHSLQGSRFRQALCGVFDPVLWWNKACRLWLTSSLDKCWTPVWVGACACKREGDHTCSSLQEKCGVELSFDLSNWQFAAWKTVCMCVKSVCVCACSHVCLSMHVCLLYWQRGRERDTKISSWCVCAHKRFQRYHFCSFSCWVWKFLFSTSETFHFPSVIVFFFLRSVMPDNSEVLLGSASVVFPCSQ